MKKVIVFLMLVACCTNVFSENSIMYDFEKKVIYASGFSMPETSSLMQVLQVLPELLHRTNSNYLENYNLKIEGLPVGDSKDAMLTQIRLMDVEKIEVTNSSTSNYENNGQGGDINIILKQLKKGTSGNATAILGLPMDFIPGFSLNNQSAKWTIRSFFTGEFYNRDGISSSIHSTAKTQSSTGSDTSTEENDCNLHQMARLYAFYKGEKDELKFSLSETWDKTIVNQTVYRSATSDVVRLNNTSRKSEFVFKTQYNHTFPWTGKAVVEALYSYVPKRGDVTMTYQTNMFSQTNDHNHSISGKVEYDQTINWGSNGSFSAEATKAAKPSANGSNGSNGSNGLSGYFRFLPGCSYNYSHMQTDADQLIANFTPYSKSRYNNLFLSPYLQIKCALGKWSIMAKGEYQVYNYKLSVAQTVTEKDGDQMNYKFTDKNFVGTFVLAWEVNKDNTLRLMANRSLKRPSESQMFPYVLYSINNLRLEYGNSDLKPMIMNTVELEYLFNHDTGANRWQMALGGRYIHTIDNINTVTEYNEEVAYDVTTWNNGNNDNILNVNAMLSWKHGWFSVLATGNFFNRHTVGTDTSHRYCNFSIVPQIQTSDDWNISLTYKHNTKLVRNSVKMPALNILSLLVSKTWKKKFTAYISGTLSLKHRADQETTLSSGSIEIKNFIPVNNSVFVGIRYNF